MTRLYATAFALVVFIALMPCAAQAYLLPLVGAGGIIITMLIGFFTVLCAAVFLLGYKVCRFFRKWRKP